MFRYTLFSRDGGVQSTISFVLPSPARQAFVTPAINPAIANFRCSVSSPRRHRIGGNGIGVHFDRTIHLIGVFSIVLFIGPKKLFLGLLAVGLPLAAAGNSYGRLPLSFETNQGQTDANVRFLARTSGYTLFVTADEAVFASHL